MTVESLELELEPGISCFGEVDDDEGARGIVLLLHDRGSDLDSVRPFAAPLRSLLLSTLLLDLPGHGLSAGTWDEHAYRAVRRALDECAARRRTVGVVAVGEACQVLYGLHPAPVQASALVAPRLSAADLAGAEMWRTVPTITMSDPCDPSSSAATQMISRWIRAWSLALSVHYTDPPEGAPQAWTSHMTYSGAAFLAEQLAYAAGDGKEKSQPLPQSTDRP